MGTLAEIKIAHSTGNKEDIIDTVGKCVLQQANNTITH
jgi:hypothetical protein